jgi:hypothetical protein
MMGQQFVTAMIQREMCFNFARQMSASNRVWAQPGAARYGVACDAPATALTAVEVWFGFPVR